MLVKSESGIVFDGVVLAQETPCLSPSGRAMCSGGVLGQQNTHDSRLLSWDRLMFAIDSLTTLVPILQVRR